MGCCDNIECVDCFVLPCSTSITLPIISDVDGTLRMVYEFNGMNIVTMVTAISGQDIVIPNILNEDYRNSIRFYRPDGTLMNNTCYIIETSPSSFVSVPGGPVLDFGRFDFVGSSGQTTFQSDKIKDADLLAVSNEKGDLVPGLGVEDYQYNPVTGIVTFNQEIGGQRISIKYWKNS